MHVIYTFIGEEWWQEYHQSKVPFGIHIAKNNNNLNGCRFLPSLVPGLLLLLPALLPRDPLLLCYYYSAWNNCQLTRSNWFRCRSFHSGFVNLLAWHMLNCIPCLIVRGGCEIMDPMWRMFYEGKERFCGNILMQKCEAYISLQDGKIINYYLFRCT